MFQIIKKYIGKYWRYAAFTPLFVCLESFVSLLLPSLMSNIIDLGIAGGDRAYMWSCGVRMVLLAVLGCICGVISTRCSTAAANGFGSNLRVALYKHIQEFSFADVDKFSTASLITRTTSDVRSLQMALQMMLRVVLQAPIQLIVSLVIVISYSPKLSIIFFAAIILLFTAVLSLMKFCHRLFMQAQQKTDVMNATIQENLIAIRVVKSFVRENYERKKFNAASEDLMRTDLKAIFMIIWMNPMTTIILNTVTILIYWFGGKMVINGQLLSGELLAIITYLTQIMGSIMMFSMALMQFTRAQACASRINEVLVTVPDILNPADDAHYTSVPATGEVEFRDVSFRYSATGTGETVLKNISFKAKPGQTIAIIGGTGSGKSTLVNLIPRFYDVSSGQVLVDGRDVRDYELSDLRQRIGMVLQKNVLFTGTIRDNMLWGKADATDDEIIAALKNAQAYDFVSAFPEGLDTEIQQGGANVSGGQKQRLCIARAMLKSPSILILDDSTSAVDSDTESRIRASFSQELKDCTVFIIAQRISSVVSADEIVVLDEGEVMAVGNHEYLMKNSPLYQDIYASQQEGVLGNA